MHSYKKKSLIIISWMLFCSFLVMMSGCSLYHRKSGLKENELAEKIHDSVPSTGNGSESPVVMPLKFYQTFISGIDGHRCPMTPSCSSYAVTAFKKYGFIRGWIMTCDRLLRCGRDETRLSPPVIIEGRQYIYDPVENNVF